MLFVGFISAVALGLTNVCLSQYVKRNPGSKLCRDVNDGCNQRVYHYAVPILSMGLGCSLLFVDMGGGVLADARKEWWFGVERRCTFMWATGLAAGHYFQEIVCKEWCGVVLFLHHIAAVLNAFCLQAASSWSGLLFSWAGVYEVGSFVLCLGYTGVVSRYFGHVAVTISTVIGMAFGIHGLIVDWPYSELNIASWFSVVALLALGVGRIQDGVENIRQIRRTARQASAAGVGRTLCAAMGVTEAAAATGLGVHQMSKPKRP